MIAFISYLPDDEKLRSFRLNSFINVLNFWRNLFPEEIFYVVDQNYQDDDKNLIVDNRLQWISYPKGIGPAAARNVLLKTFYESSDTWLILSDDDVVLYDYYDIKTLLTDIYSGKCDNYPMDLIVPLSPQIRPFKEKLIKESVDKFFIFQPCTLTDIPNLLFLRNTENQIFYDENLLDQNIPEDASFIASQVASGNKCVICLCAVKKNLALDNSTIYPDESSDDPVFHRLLNQNLDKYISDKYGVIKSQFTKYYSKARPFKISRSHDYKIPDNLLNIKKRQQRKIDVQVDLWN